MTLDVAQRATTVNVEVARHANDFVASRAIVLRIMQHTTSEDRATKRQHYLAEWADFRGIKQSVIVAATGADKSLVSRWLNKGVEPKENYLEDLAVLFDTTRDSLFYPPVDTEFIYTDEDPAAPDNIDPDAAPTIGEHTGRRGIPADSSAQIDVTAGMGGGGLTIVSEGVPGRSGMTFAAEHVSDYWRLPGPVLSSLGGAKAADIIFIPVQGDSMLPTLHEGDVVVVDTRHRWPSPDGIYALNDAFGGIVVKRLEVVTRPGDDEQMVDVISDNERHPRKTWRVEDLRIVGRVLRKFGNVV